MEGKKRDDAGKDQMGKIGTIVIAVILALVILTVDSIAAGSLERNIYYVKCGIVGLWNVLANNPIITLGLLSFFIPLLLSFSKRLNLGTRLSKGEVRKSIVISFTVVYIILLAQSFVKTGDLAANNATINATITAATNVT